MIRVYLSGPITGQTLDEATEWRTHAAMVLEDAGLEVLDPSRGMMFLKPETVLEDSYENDPIWSKHAVFARDKFDATRSDVTLVNLTKASRVSIGTVMELAWCHLSNRFAVVVMEKEGNPHMHAFVREAAGVVLDDLNEALTYIIETFGRGAK